MIKKKKVRKKRGNGEWGEGSRKEGRTGGYENPRVLDNN